MIKPMIRSLLKTGYRRFGRRYGYDTGYMAHIADTSVSAGLRLTAFPADQPVSRPRAQSVGRRPAGDRRSKAIAGPAPSLSVDMAIEAGVPADRFALCIQGRAEEAGDVGLGFRFAQAAIGDDPELDTLRTEIESRYGQAAVTAASFAASSGRMYPVLKRGLGFGHACSVLSVGNVKVERAQ